MSKQIQVKKISGKKISFFNIFLLFFFIKKYNYKNLTLFYHKFKWRKKSFVFILFFIKFAYHKGILVRKHQGINTSSKQRKIHIQIPKEMTACASILVKQKEKEMHMFKIVNINLYPKSQ